MLSRSPAARSRAVLALLAFLPASSAWAASETDKAWNSLVDSRPKEALRALGEHPDTREGKLARGTALMSLQPATDGNMRAAEDIFSDLSAGSDDVAAEAAYLRARLYQLHYSKPDYKRAAELYQALDDRFPTSHWAQLGLVKLAMLQMYILTEGSSGDRLAPAETLLARISDPLLQRDLNLQIGQAGIELHQPLTRVIPHLIAADRIGGITGTAREDLVVQIGELSLRAGLLPQAQAYFERYLREYPDNLRAYVVRLHLEQAKKRMAKEPGP